MGFFGRREVAFDWTLMEVTYSLQGGERTQSEFIQHVIRLPFALCYFIYSKKSA